MDSNDHPDSIRFYPECIDLRNTYFPSRSVSRHLNSTPSQKGCIRYSISRLLHKLRHLRSSSPGSFLRKFRRRSSRCMDLDSTYRSLGEVSNGRGKRRILDRLVHRLVPTGQARLCRI